jgi:hypothetical protein
MGTDGCMGGHGPCMMAYGVKDGEVVFDNFAYYRKYVRNNNE